MSQPAILSDVGKVLIDFDFSIASRRLAQQCDHPAETVLTLFDDIKGPYEVGEIDDAEFVRQGMALTGFRGTPEEFEAIWCEIFAQNEPMHATLGALAGRLPMHLLSNTTNCTKSTFCVSSRSSSTFRAGCTRTLRAVPNRGKRSSSKPPRS
jgi:hypothetical protein